MTDVKGSTSVREEVAAEHERLAAEAFERIRTGQHFRDWVFVGYGLVAGRTRAMREVFTNEPKGRPYNEAFGRWMDRQPNQWPRKLDKATTAHCFWLIDHLPQVEAWRDRLAANQREVWNHPTTVRRNYERAERGQGARESRRGRAGQVADAAAEGIAGRGRDRA
jgi:hypothetical protein